MTAPAIILSHPQLGENIGATARAMKNFALSELRLVNPTAGRAGATEPAANLANSKQSWKESKSRWCRKEFAASSLQRQPGLGQIICCEPAKK